jgi:hypothetical protein
VTNLIGTSQSSRIRATLSTRPRQATHQKQKILLQAPAQGCKLNEKKCFPKEWCVSKIPFSIESGCTYKPLAVPKCRALGRKRNQKVDPDTPEEVSQTLIPMCNVHKRSVNQGILELLGCGSIKHEEKKRRTRTRGREVFYRLDCALTILKLG